MYSTINDKSNINYIEIQRCKHRLYVSLQILSYRVIVRILDSIGKVPAF